jgi:flagellar export protein FliJ
MKAFRFTLEAVRIVRQRQEQETMEHYAQALLVRQQATARLEEIQQELGAAWQELRARLAGGCSAGVANQAHTYRQTLEKRREECAAALGVAERRVNAALQAMLAARRQREVVDKCLEKQKARHGREMSRLEQKVMDDLAGRRTNSIFSWNPTGNQS